MSITQTEITARMQDIINGLRDTTEPAPVAFGWTIQNDLLHLIAPVISPYHTATGELVTPDSLVISSWDLSQAPAKQQADFLIDNPVPMEHRADADYEQTVLAAAQDQLHEHITQSGVSHGKAVTLTDPSTLQPLRTGWQEATEIGIRDATKYVPDIVRLSFLQSQVGSHTIPMTWALEENGRDLHVITWYPSDDPTRAHAELKHYQYELVDGMPRSELIHVVTNLRISPGNLTEERLAVSSQRILDWYQRKGRYPTTEFTDLPDWKPPTYTQADMMLHGGTPTLTYQGEPVPSWSELERQAALSYLQGRNLDLRNIYTAQQKNNNKKKGSIMVDQLDIDTQQIMIHIDNNESLVSSIESYAVGLEAMQAPQQTQIKTNDSVPAVANMIVSRAVQKLQEEDLAQGAEPRVYSDEVLASARQEVSDRIIENAQYLLDEKLGHQAPQQTRKSDNITNKTFARVNIPHQFVHPYQMHAKDGRVFDKAIINLPDGVTLNGINVSGYSIDRFMNKSMQEDKANGRPVTLSFAADKPISIFRGKGQNRETITIDDPWILCKAIKAEQTSFTQKHSPQAQEANPASDKKDAAVSHLNYPNYEANIVDLEKQFGIGGHQMEGLPQGWRGYDIEDSYIISSPAGISYYEEDLGTNEYKVFGSSYWYTLDDDLTPVERVRQVLSEKLDPHRQAVELAAYTQENPTTHDAFHSTAANFMDAQKDGTYNQEHALEITQRITDKALEMYQKDLTDCGLPVQSYSQDERRLIAQQALKNMGDLIGSKMITTDLAAIQPNTQTTPTPKQPEKTPTANTQTATRQSFMSQLKDKTSEKLATSQPQMIRPVHHARSM